MAFSRTNQFIVLLGSSYRFINHMVISLLSSQKYWKLQNWYALIDHFTNESVFGK